MKKQVFLIALAFVALMFFSETRISRFYNLPDTPAPEILEIENIRGMYVASQDNLDYPSKPDMRADEMTAEARKIAETAKENGFNSLFYEAAPSGCSMYASEYYSASSFWKSGDSFHYSDPLKTLQAEAVRQGLHLFAVVNLFDDTADNANISELTLARTEELIDKYDLNGLILVDNSHTADDTAHAVEIAELCAESIRSFDNRLLFGYGKMLSRDSKQAFSAMQTLSEAKNIDFISPVMTSDFDILTTENRGIYTAFWNNAESKAVVPLHIVAAEQSEPDTMTEQLIARIFTDYQQEAVGEIIGSFATLTYENNILLEKLEDMEYSLINLNFPFSELQLPQKLMLTYPENNLQTTDTACYITGFSDPEQELTVNGIPVSGRGKNGSFGIWLPLQPGENLFELEQAESFASVTIHRTEESQSVISVINQIQADSAFPKSDAAVRNEKSIQLSCVAPFGGEVTAKLGEKTYQLQPQAQAGENGVPVVYSAEIPIKQQNIKQSKTALLGTVTYTLTYDGIVTNQKSSGELYVMGARADLAVEVNRYSADVLTAPQENAELLTALKNGARDFAVRSVGDFYELESGGYIHKNHVSVLTGVNEVEQPIDNVILQLDEQSERLVFIGGEGLPWHLNYDQFRRIVTLTVFHGEGVPDILAHLKSEMFSEISIENDTVINKSTVTLQLAPDAVLWGYNAAYNEGNLEVVFNKPPVPSNNLLPLEGVKILIDAGHGGSDNGTLGTANLSGPAEKDLTLITAKFLKNRLEQFGAEVYMTRDDDSYLVNDRRLQMVSSLNVDMVISLHYKGLSAQENGNHVYGIEGRYGSIFSKELTTEILTRLVKDTGRTNRGVSHIDNPDGIMETAFCPAVQLNLGYLSNPAEYDRSCNLYEMYRIADSISFSIRDYMDSESEQMQKPAH